MVLVMESDGSLTATQSQNSFARNYNDGVSQGSAAEALAIFDEPDAAAATEEVLAAAIAPRAPLPSADVLSAIEATALRGAVRQTRTSLKCCRLTHSLGCQKLAPLGIRGGSKLLHSGSADLVSLRVEVIVKASMG